MYGFPGGEPLSRAGRIMGLGLLAVIGVVAVAGYLFSLRIHPLKECPLCRATARHFSVYERDPRRCRKCDGTGRVDRAGTRLAFGGTSSTGVFPRRVSGKIDVLRQRVEDRGTDAAGVLAGWLVGSKRAYLQDAWAADLHGDPDRGKPSSGRRLRLATGFVVAAIRVRLKDLAELAWQPVDALLASWRGSQIVILVPVVTTAAVAVVCSSGLYGVVVNADNLTCIATASYLAIKGLRRYPNISSPKRPIRRNLPAGRIKSGFWRQLIPGPPSGNGVRFLPEAIGATVQSDCRCRCRCVSRTMSCLPEGLLRVPGLLQPARSGPAVPRRGRGSRE